MRVRMSLWASPSKTDSLELGMMSPRKRGTDIGGAPELFVNLVHSARHGDLERAAELHRRVLSLVTLGAYSDPPISAIKLAMNKLGVPISPAVRGPAPPILEEAHEKVECVLREVGLLTLQEVG